MISKIPSKFRENVFRRWVVCKLISDKQSVKYGIYFSYPIYILIVVTGVLLMSPYILFIAVVIAFLGIKLPMHPFDYVYNYTFAKLFGMNKILDEVLNYKLIA